MTRRARAWLLCVTTSACTPGGGDDELGGESSSGESSGGELGDSESSGSESGSSESSGSESSDDTTDTTDTTDTGETGGDPDPCVAFQPTGSIVMVQPSDAAMLPGMVAAAEPDTTFVFAPGTYDMSASMIVVTVPNLRFMALNGNRADVVLDGGHAIGEIFLVTASHTLIAHLTLVRPYYHAIHVTGGSEADIENVAIHDVVIRDPREQAIKINPSPSGHYADYGSISCSHIELTDAGRPIVDNDCYTGGIDAHAARGWAVYDNHIEGFWCEQGLSEHAVHFWVTSRDTQVQRNRIVDCARGVGFGLGEQGNGNSREYPDDPCPDASYLGHVDGEITNNMIVAARPELFASQYGFDSGVALEQACGAIVAHNSVAALEPPFVSIEYRWPNTSATIVNNLTTHGIVQRDGGVAMLLGNLSDEGLEHFVDAAGGDLHLAPGSAAIDAGVVGDPLYANTDFDREARDGSPDVGADERVR